MKNLNPIAEDLFSKIRGRFPNLTIGDSDGNITMDPEQARFFEFSYVKNNEDLGKITVSLDQDNGVVVMHNSAIAEYQHAKSDWFKFLKELRRFAKQRLLNFDTRDINKSNLEKKDYQYLATRHGDNNMNESKLYGSEFISYQKVDEARIVIKHNEAVDTEIPTSRTRNIKSIYIENAAGERFKYPYRHLSGARAMARHVAEGGNPYDDFGSHITELSEEMWKLRKFKNYVGRSAVMAESLADYMDIVKERVTTIKKTIESLQKPSRYHEAVDTFEKPIFEEVPEDVKENWIDQLTVRQFNEELKDVFPYIYRLVGENSRVKELGPEDLLGEDSQLQEFNIKTSKNFMHDGEYKNYDIYVSKQKDNRGHYMSYALSGDKEMPKLRGQGPNPQTALKMTKEKINAVETEAEKINSSASINLNVNFIREELPYSTRTEAGDVFYAKLDKGPSLVIANEKWGDDAKELGFQKVSYKKLKSAEGTSSGGVFAMPASVIASLDLVRHGRYVLGSPKTDKDENYVFPMTFHSVAAASNDPLKLGKPAVGINPMRGQQESFDEDLVSEDNDPCWKGYKQVGMKKKNGKKVPNCVPEDSSDTENSETKPSLGEFILSYFDRETGQFPKGETAVLTMIEKDYGKKFIEPAKAFIEAINNKIAEKQKYRKASGNNMSKRSSDEMCKECGNPNWRTLGMTEEEIEEGERHGNSKIYDKCWKGYRKVPGKKRGEPGSCKKIESGYNTEEGNAYAHSVRKAKMSGKEKGDKIQGPNGDEITLEKDSAEFSRIIQLAGL